MPTPGPARALGQTRRVDDRDAQLIRIDAGGWGLTWAPDGRGVLRQVGLGPTGQDADIEVPGLLSGGVPDLGRE